MPAETSVSVKIDTEAGAAYLRLERSQVERTVEFDEDIYVDLDQFGVVVGIELLDLDTFLPLDELGARFHINASALEVLVKAIQWGAPRRNVASEALQAGTSSSARCTLQAADRRRMVESSMRTLWSQYRRPDISWSEVVPSGRVVQHLHKVVLAVSCGFLPRLRWRGAAVGRAAMPDDAGY